MRAYISYFKCQIAVGLQYKSAAFAGLITQFFWGILYVFVYEAFYNHASVENINFSQLMCYVWLNQAFFYLVVPGIKDNQIIEQIKNGTVAYELCRPYDLYWWWYLKHLAVRFSGCALRSIPVIIFAFVLPKPYGLTLPCSKEAFVLFIIAIVLGSFITSEIFMIVQIITFYTYHEKGISSLIYIIQGLLQGFDIPLPLLPVLFLTLTEFLPFRLISDLGERIYSGNIGIIYGLQSILLQIIWIIILIIIGKLLMNKALRKVSVQGG